LSWGAIAQASGYRVFQVAGSQNTLLATLGSGATSYQATGLTPASTVSFLVEAFNGATVADSAPVSVTLPTGQGAANIAIQNASFEAPALTSPGSWTTTAPTAWTMTGTGGVFSPRIGVDAASVPDGSQVAWLYSGTLFQDTGVAVDPTKTYQLSVSVGTQLNYWAPTDGYRIELVAGGVNGTVIAQASGTLQAKAGWTTISVAGKGLGTGNLGILIVATGGQPLFDNVQLQAT
jgi:hypothetical protein